MNGDFVFPAVRQCHKVSAVARQYLEESFLSFPLLGLSMANLTVPEMNRTGKIFGLNINDPVEAVKADQLDEVSQVDVVESARKTTEGALT